MSGNKHATIISAHAPMKTNPDEVKDKFYDDLDSVISEKKTHTNTSFFVTSMPELAQTTTLGKANATIMVFCS